jgi:hypothetical protein
METSKMFRTAKVAFVLALAALSTAPLANGATDSEKRACQHDVARHCRTVMHESEQRVGQCLIVNAAYISRACQQVLRNHGQL